MDAGSLAGLKALYSDARKRAGVAAGIGAYLYTALAPVVLPIGPNPRQVQAIRRQGKGDLLVLSAGDRAVAAPRLSRRACAPTPSAATSARCSPTANPRPRWARARRTDEAARPAAQPSRHRHADRRAAATDNGARRRSSPSTSAASGPPRPDAA